MEKDKQQNHYVTSLMASNPYPQVILTAEGKIHAANKALCGLTEVAHSTLLGTYFPDYFTEFDRAQDVYQQTLEKGQIINHLLTIKTKSEKASQVYYHGSAYKNGEGSVGYVFVSLVVVDEQRDITDLRLINKALLSAHSEKEKIIKLLTDDIAGLREENHDLILQNKRKETHVEGLIHANTALAIQQVEKPKKDLTNKELQACLDGIKLSAHYSLSLMEANLDPLVAINSEGKITATNEAMVRATGVARHKLKGSDFKTYFTEPDTAGKAYNEVFQKGFVKDYPLVIKNKALTDVLFNGTVYKDTKGNVISAIIVARDMTEQKQVERELLEVIAFAKHATGNAEKAKSEAENAAIKAKESAKSKQQFLSNMSHEIRTPMNAIIGFTKVVLKTELTAKQREYLMAIKMSGDALIVLINDILDLAKVDAGRMEFEQIPFRMAHSISAMLQLFEPKIQEKNLRLIREYDSTIPDVLLGDPVRLHQIILNLLSNAVKFTSDGSITLSVRLQEEDDAKVKIEFAITDTGIGIQAEKTDKIFENFQQASTGTSRLYGGTGLGLAIVKQLVEQQGGTIKVQSKINIGSTFSFSLDFNKTTSEAVIENETIDADSELKDVKVLVVEDIPLNQLLMKTLLDDFGFERDIAANGQIAIEKLKTKEYDIILMDLQMPILNGFETTEFIRKNLKLNIPIIALTADVTTADLAKCKAVGMNDYIAKPVDEKSLYTKMTSLIKKNNQPDINETSSPETSSVAKLKCINLVYLSERTKSDPALMMEMISLYLEQTPPLITTMKESVSKKDWPSLHAAVHKMIPSFAIMGINPDFESMAKKVQEYAQSQEQSEQINDMVLKLESICLQACLELEEEFNTMKNRKQ